MCQRFSEVVSETLSEADFPLRGLSVLLPLIVLTLELYQFPSAPNPGVSSISRFGRNFPENFPRFLPPRWAPDKRPSSGEFPSDGLQRYGLSILKT